MTDASFRDIYRVHESCATAVVPPLVKCERGDRAATSKVQERPICELDYSLFRGHGEKPRSTYANLCNGPTTDADLGGARTLGQRTDDPLAYVTEMATPEKDNGEPSANRSERRARKLSD
jgi:hypothetical protein